ncbi:MAG TPA: ABC transporter permease [Microlunatus sp.]
MTEPITENSNLPVAPTAPPAQDVPRARARSAWIDRWHELRRNPVFWVSAVLILLFLTMAVVPQLFTSIDPTYADLSKARQKPSAEHWFGMDGQGADVYARTIYGARASILVGAGTALVTLIFGCFMGVVAAYFGRGLDAVLQRTGEIFMAFPLLLGGLLILYQFPSDPDDPYALQVGRIILILAIFGWPVTARIMRSSVLQVLPNDYIQSARALGGGGFRIIFSHVVPNAIAASIVVSTINLGVFMGVEATLSYLGIGFQPPVISWGVAISDASGIGLIQAAPHMLLFPSLFLSVAVLSFILLGDAVRDALDPRLR